MVWIGLIIAWPILRDWQVFSETAVGFGCALEAVIVARVSLRDPSFLSVPGVKNRPLATILAFLMGMVFVVAFTLGGVFLFPSRAKEGSNETPVTQ